MFKLSWFFHLQNLYPHIPLNLIKYKKPYQIFQYGSMYSRVSLVEELHTNPI